MPSFPHCHHRAITLAAHPLRFKNNFTVLCSFCFSNESMNTVEEFCDAYNGYFLKIPAVPFLSDEETIIPVSWLTECNVFSVLYETVNKRLNIYDKSSTMRFRIEDMNETMEANDIQKLHVAGFCMELGRSLSESDNRAKLILQVGKYKRVQHVVDFMLEIVKNPGVVHFEIDGNTGSDILEAMIDQRNRIVEFTNGMIFVDLPSLYNTPQKRGAVYSKLANVLPRDTHKFELEFKKEALRDVNVNVLDIFGHVGMNPTSVQLYRPFSMSSYY